jgi:hypothetical protein
MGKGPINIQLIIDGNYILGGRAVKIHSTTWSGGTKVPSSGSEFVTQLNGIIQLPSEWRGHDITEMFVYDKRGKKTEYRLKKKKPVPRDGDGPIRVELKRA